MNIDHFMLQDNNQVNLLSEDDVSEESILRTTMEEELSIESANDYLEELRENWSELPNPAAAIKEASDDAPEESKKKKGKKDKKKSKKDKALKKIGGPWGERYSLTLVGPSLVPNFFPTLRIVEYNITGLDAKATWASAQSRVPAEKKTGSRRMPSYRLKRHRSKRRRRERKIRRNQRSLISSFLYRHPRARHQGLRTLHKHSPS